MTLLIYVGRRTTYDYLRRRGDRWDGLDGKSSNSAALHVCGGWFESGARFQTSAGNGFRTKSANLRPSAGGYGVGSLSGGGHGRGEFHVGGEGAISTESVGPLAGHRQRVPSSGGRCRLADGGAIRVRIRGRLVRVAVAVVVLEEGEQRRGLCAAVASVCGAGGGVGAERVDDEQEIADAGLLEDGTDAGRPLQMADLILQRREYVLLFAATLAEAAQNVFVFDVADRVSLILVMVTFAMRAASARLRLLLLLLPLVVAALLHRQAQFGLFLVVVVVVVLHAAPRRLPGRREEIEGGHRHSANAANAGQLQATTFGWIVARNYFQSEMKNEKLYYYFFFFLRNSVLSFFRLPRPLSVVPPRRGPRLISK